MAKNKLHNSASWYFIGLIKTFYDYLFPTKTKPTRTLMYKLQKNVRKAPKAEKYHTDNSTDHHTSRDEAIRAKKERRVVVQAGVNLT